VQPVPQLDRGQRVETQVGEGPVRLDRLSRRVTEHRGHMRADQIQHQRILVGRGEGR
jgi:hypothetical protein